MKIIGVSPLFRVSWVSDMKNLIKLLLIMSLGIYSGLSFSALTTQELINLEKAAETGDSNALQTLKAKADGGDAEAQYQFGNFMFFKALEELRRVGDGKEMVKKQFEWHLKAAEQGHQLAQCQIGRSYKDGFGVTQDVTKAISWVQKSADQGSACGKRLLGELGVKTNSSTNSNNLTAGNGNNTVSLNEPDDPQVLGASASPRSAKAKGKKKSN
ncbi:MAG: sel1 repeat family protein [Methyloglobulus sp.]|nr:sel1 repeat family protein [Methyloglobulus sp.]